MILKLQYYFLKSTILQADNWMFAFLKDELRFTIPFELLPVLLGGVGGGGVYDAASGKSPELLMFA